MRGHIGHKHKSFLQARLNLLGASLVLVVAPLVAPLFAVGAPVSAQAAPAFNLTASPLPVNLITKPGVSVSTPIQIENSGTQTVRIKVSLQKFSAEGNGGKPQIEDPTPEDAFISWAHFSETSFDAAPNVFHTITMTITPPKTAAFGYYYAVVFSVDTSKTPIPAAPRQNKVNGALATLILLDVNAPGEKRQLSIVSFTATKKVYQYLPATFNVTLKNTGNVHVIPTGDVFLKKGNTSLAVLDVNKEQGNILPNSNRTFTTDWSDGFPVYQVKKDNGQIISDKHGHPIEQLSWDASKLGKFRFGHYTAHLTMAYSDGTRDIPVDAETSFWVIPWKLLAVAFILLLLICIGLFYIFRNIFRQTKKIKTKKPNTKPPQA